MRSLARKVAPILHRAAYALWARYPALNARPARYAPCITVKLDGPLHVRNAGWQGGAMYGPMAPGGAEALRALLIDGYAVAVRTQRADLRAVAAWLESNGVPAVASDGEPLAYWWRTDAVLVTRAAVTSPMEISQYGYTFRDWSDALMRIDASIKGVTP